MSGLFEIGLAATGVGGKLQMQDGFAGSFFTGALATLVATPCSAPFLAPALGAALSLSAVESFLVFTAIAVGLALPYLLLSSSRRPSSCCPDQALDGDFKQLMAFPFMRPSGGCSGFWPARPRTMTTRCSSSRLLVLVAMAAGLRSLWPA